MWLKEENNQSARENIEKVISEQEKILNSNRMNSAEFQLVEKNLNEILKTIER